MNESEQIIRRLNDYARACDNREWGLMEQVFAEELRACYGGHRFASREQLIAIIRRTLSGCGPTQHLLGNYQIEFDGSHSARSSCYVRAAHAGLGATVGEVYEVWGEYRDIWFCRDGCWQIVERDLLIRHETGNRAVLKARNS